MLKKVSIITINYNNYCGLKKTVESVLSQNSNDYEYIVIDGGSTDNSIDFIENNSDKFDFWVSEPDNGIYDAMNKGLRYATGEYCLFLNSGDYLADRFILNRVIPSLNGVDIIYGNFFHNYHNELIKKESANYYHLFELVYTSFPHPATFVRTSLLKQLGGFDANFKIISDWLFFLRAIIDFNCTMLHIEEYITVFEVGGISSTGDNHREQMDAIRKYYPFLEDAFTRFKQLRHYQLSRPHRYLDKFLKILKKNV